MNLTTDLKFNAWFASKAHQEDGMRAKYVHLAPTDEADEAGIYAGALDFATNEQNVSNIALTGPYGSGKSSIIRTFLKNYERPALTISLAAFLPETDMSVTAGNPKERRPQIGAENKQEKSKVSTQEIERSILQQMLYGADANSLPLSRFKRIQRPKSSSWFISLFIILGLFACWYLAQNRDEIISGDFFKPLDRTNWFNFASFTVGLLFLWQALHQIYVKSLGFSLKTISLKDIEITPEAAEEESILNRHLDEIIYFFQSTKYDLVIIEDLDRFDDPSIFVTLREINSLINNNADVNRRIRFLYALRDNMFVTTDRTKFFEFIIPVIPIINNSNSIDKIIEHVERLSLEQLDRQFLREVSRYLNDLRLINNIFNEYATYVSNLATDGENILNENKLLAILIYKNVIPSDFEELHREKGKLAAILNGHATYVANAEACYKAQISDLEKQISNAEKQVPSDLEELRKIYAMALIEKAPHDTTHIGISRNSRIPLGSLSEHQDFEQIIGVQEIWCYGPQYGIQRQNITNFQQEIDPIQDYQKRKEEIEYRSNEFKNTASKNIRELRSNISNLRTTNFNEIIRLNTNNTDELFEAFGENKELVRFLVFEGFLDDTYYQYTSLFHSGRLSPNDNKFLIQIRSYNNPEPNFQIDNPKEVIAAMRIDDFQKNFVLNKTIVDCMLNNQADYSMQIAMMIGFISKNFAECGAFFSTYYETGKRISELLSALIDRWPGFVSAAITTPDNVTHIAQMIAHLPEKQLETLHQKDLRISEFLSKNLSGILALGIDFEPNRLRSLKFETKDLNSIGAYPAIARLLTDEGLFETSIENFEFIFRDVLRSTAVTNLQTKHYSTVLQTENVQLISKVQHDFDHYFKSVLLTLENNTEEEISAIIKVINHAEIETEYLEQFIEKQSAKLPSIDQIPVRLHSPLFRLQKIEPSWENCLAYLTSENFDAKTLTAFLQASETLATLSTITVEGQKSGSPLLQFLINNNDLEDETYRTYIRRIPNQFTQFPNEIDQEKLRILIKEGKITFSINSFSFLSEYDELQLLFMANNIDVYFSNTDQYAIDDDFREEILASDISDDHKLKIINEMDLSIVSDLPTRASVIGQIFYRANADVSSLQADAAQAVITNTRPITAQISLFNKCQKALSVEQIWATIQQLPKPFSKIEKGWGQPIIPNTPENREFVRWLEARSIISSSKKTFFDEIRIYNFRK